MDAGPYCVVTTLPGRCARVDWRRLKYGNRLLESTARRFSRWAGPSPGRPSRATVHGIRDDVQPDVPVHQDLVNGPPPSRTMPSARRVSTTDIARPQSCGCRLDDGVALVHGTSLLSLNAFGHARARARERLRRRPKRFMQVSTLAGLGYTPNPTSGFAWAIAGVGSVPGFRDTGCRPREVPDLGLTGRTARPARRRATARPTGYGAWCMGRTPWSPDTREARPLASPD
jgi:hypothetical protein